MKLHCSISGSGDDLVLLHGWGMNSAIWGAFLETLAERFRVTLVELPGHGESGFDLQHTSLEEWADEVLAVAPQRAFWIGWSLGAQVAMQAALSAPERVAALVLLAATPRFVQGEQWPHAMEGETLRQFAVTLSKNHRQTLERFLSLQVQGDSEARGRLRSLRQELFRRPQPQPAALENGLELLRSVDLRGRLREIPCPTLWLLGERDTLVPAAVADPLGELQPGAEIEVVQGAAHTPFLSHPRLCMQRLESFLQEQ
jgi:pimeloyl-[acyl-carrier protein] methyl ester esterase